MIKMEEFDIYTLLRRNIRELVPYSSARDEYSGEGAILLDANENPFNSPYNRYPDPLQRKLKGFISALFNIDSSCIFLGNGSDEAIDLLIRAFCDPGIDNILSIDPSYGMYEVCAKINDVKVKKALLNDDFSLNSQSVLKLADNSTKLVFLCSPNNPTANLLDTESILQIVKSFRGIVVVDEAYIDFSVSGGLLPFLSRHPNLVILRTFSKAWGLAGIRLGMALAYPEIIKVLNKIKYPYNVNFLTQELAMKYLNSKAIREKWIRGIIESRKQMVNELNSLHFVKRVFPSDANFLLVKVNDPIKLYDYLKDHKLIIRDRSRVSLCEGCLRITIGTVSENRRLIGLLKEFGQKYRVKV